MQNKTTTQALTLLTCFWLIFAGTVVCAVGLLLLTVILSVYGLPFTAVIFLANALLHFFTGSAWLGFLNTVAIGYTLGFAAKILRKVF